MFWWSDIISGGLGPPSVVNAGHYLAMGTGQTKILSHWRAKKRSLMTFLPTAISGTILFQGLGGKKKPSLPHKFFGCCNI